MSEYIELQPLDTLFFRGSTPMEAGVINAVSMFPPPVSVVKGALWTQICKEKAVDENIDYGDGNIPFEVTAFMIKKTVEGKSKYYVQAPATWYYDSAKKVSTGRELADSKNNIFLIEAEDKSVSLSKLGVITSAGNIVFVKPEVDAKSLSSSWVSLDFLLNPKKTFAENDFLFSGEIFSREDRTCVALDKNKKTIDGKLFSSTHIRLHENISIVICIDKKTGLSKNGKLLLGGEQRVCEYKILNEDILEKFNELKISNTQFVSFVPIEASEENIKLIVSSQKLIVTSGWDYAKKFHKKSNSWIPAGSVFSKKINDSCVPLVQKK